MRIVHTSDWHVGRRWLNRQRNDEMRAVLDNLARYVLEERVDLLIHSGDVYDGRNPDGDSEDMVNEFLVRLGSAGVRVVIIAGNHDDAARFDAVARLSEYVNAKLLGKPRRASAGGTFELETAGGERAVVAALPFASPGVWVNALELAGDEGEARSRYAAMFQMAVGQLTAGFQAHAVNLLVAHTHLHGAAFGGSERAVHLGEDWAAPVQVLPTTAHYIALGHIHKPQQIEGAVPARYAGSALQLDFGEAGDEKSFVLVEAEPRTRATVTPVPYEGGIPLGEAAGTLDELEASASEYRQAGWLRVTVKLDAPDPEINRKVRQLLPNATKVRVDLPKQEHDGANMDDGNVDSRSRPAERFKAYYHHTNRTLGDRVLAAFVELLEEEETAE